MCQPWLDWSKSKPCPKSLIEFKIRSLFSLSFILIQTQVVTALKWLQPIYLKPFKGTLSKMELVKSLLED
jgi:hypothetical protein